VLWFADHWDDVLSDWSAIHHKDPKDLELMTTREFWPKTLRLVHYQGAVRDVAMAARSVAPAPGAVDDSTTPAPQPDVLVDPTPEQIRAMRNAARRKRYPADRFGEMKFVNENEIVREASRA